MTILAKEPTKGWFPEWWGDPDSRVELYTDSLKLISEYSPLNPHLIGERGPMNQDSYGKRLTSFGVPNCNGIFHNPNGLVEKQGVECYVIYAPMYDIAELKAAGFVTDPRDLIPAPPKKRAPRKSKSTETIATDNTIADVA